LPPGSPEAKEADRKKDLQRKRLARETAAAVAEPAPLPSLATPGPGPGPASPPPVAPVQPGQEPPPVPWQADTLVSLVDQLIEAAEENRVGGYLAACAEAGLTGKLVKQIEEDAHFPKTAKVLLKQSLPRLAAKWLNRAGLSAEWQEEISVLTALILIVQHDRKTRARFNELLEEIRKQKKKDPEPAAAVPPAGVDALKVAA
jgi:hypothetical protein